jgi:uridine phosphorylase
MKNYSEDPSRQYHIQVAPGEVGRYVLLPGDPKRCKKIAAYFDDPELIADNREFVTYTGTLEGVPVSVTSTGIGGPSASIAVEELVRCGADTFLRVGTCGGMQPEVKSGDVVISTGSIRMEGTSREYAPIEYPAVADLAVTNAFIAGACAAGLKPGILSVSDIAPASPIPWNPSDHGAAGPSAASGMRGTIQDPAYPGTRYHLGVSQSKDAFYGQHEPGKMPAGYELLAKWESWKMMGCLASEMESAAIFIASMKLRVRAGACFLVVANQEREALGLPNPVVRDTDLAIRTAVNALRHLIHEEL